MTRKIHVVVKPRARRAGVEKIADGEYRVSVRAPAQDGQANDALTELLAEHFNVGRSKVKILRGLSSRHKLIEIAE